MTAAQQRERADVIFNGLALEGPTATGIQRFRVTRYFKGSGPRVVRVNTTNPTFGVRTIRPCRCEAPENGKSGERVDEAVEPEADEGDGRGGDTRNHRNEELDEVPGVPAPREHPGALDESSTLANIERTQSPTLTAMSED